MRLIRAGAQNVSVATASGRTALIVAAAFGYAQLLKKLLMATDLDARRRYDDPAHDGATPILLASEGNNVMIADRSSIHPPPVIGEYKPFLDSERVSGGLSGRRRGTRCRAA